MQHHAAAVVFGAEGSDPAADAALVDDLVFDDGLGALVQAMGDECGAVRAAAVGAVEAVARPSPGVPAVPPEAGRIVSRAHRALCRTAGMHCACPAAASGPTKSGPEAAAG